jgi:hypothetical protein
LDHFVVYYNPSNSSSGGIFYKPNKIVPLFGKCPSSEDGSWAYIAKDDNDQYFIAFECLPVNKAFGLIARLAEVLALVEDANSHVRVTDSYHPDLGHVIVGDVAQFNVVPHTHVRVVRK